MKKKDISSICWILIVSSLLMAISGCVATPNTTDPSLSGNMNSSKPSESTTASESTSPETQPTTPTADPTEPAPTESTAPTEPKPTEAEPTEPEPTEAVPTDPTEPEPTTPITSDHYTHSGDKSFQNMKFTYSQLPGAITIKDQYGYQSLGTMQLEDYPIDGVYDQAFNCIKVGDTYKMWWGRACPFDTIWYAESKDMKNWYNAQCVIDLKGYRTTWIKEMLLWSSVLYVDGTYHMFFETPATIDSQGEYNNNICYATSKDGIKWTFYPDNENPQPVIKNPSTGRSYGVGQPKAFYKDGAFYIVYTDASDGGGKIRVAKSVGDPFHFGEVSTHPVIMNGVAGASVRYNETTGKYYMLVSTDVNTGAGNSMGIYIQESEDLYNWPYTSVSRLKIKGGVIVDPNEITKKSNPDFVTNDKGVVLGENMIFMYMVGEMPGMSEDHRNTHTTWDGCIGVLTVEGAYGKAAVLPNGKTATAQNLVWYQDRVATWVQPSVMANQGTAVVDGVKDDAYGNRGALIESVTWAGEHSKPTSTTGVAYWLWDAAALYMFIAVRDSTPNKNGSIEKNDSITLYVSPLSANGGTNTNGYWMTVDAAGNYRVVNGEGNDISAALPGLTAKVKTTADGYTVEVKLPWYGAVKNTVGKNASVNIDICITDNIGMTRNARVFWSDYSGSTDKVLDRYGRLILN